MTSAETWTCAVIFMKIGNGLVRTAISKGVKDGGDWIAD